MRIAINTRFLLKTKMEGFGWFTFEVVSRLVKEHPEHDFFFLFDRPYDAKFVFADNVTPLVVYPPARHPILFKIWFNQSVKRVLKKYKIDLFFSPDGFLSLTSDIKQVGVIHDINFEHYPEDLPKSARNYLLKYFPLFAKKANHLITVSEFSKQDIADVYNIDLNKITVAHNSASDQFKPIPKEEQYLTRGKYTNGKPYFLYVGALHARKNIHRLLHAFDLYKKENKSDVQLLIVGEELWKNKSFEETKAQLKYTSEIHFTGHVDLSVLTKITGSALALTFVSYYEGFGIPLVEAMQCGIPILSGDKTSLPEVAEKAALYVDPFDVKDIAQKMSEMAANETLRDQLSKKGLERAKSFSWDTSAKIIWEVIAKEMEQ